MIIKRPAEDSRYYMGYDELDEFEVMKPGDVFHYVSAGNHQALSGQHFGMTISQLWLGSYSRHDFFNAYGVYRPPQEIELNQHFSKRLPLP